MSEPRHPADVLIDEGYVTVALAAEQVGVSIATIHRWARATPGRGPLIRPVMHRRGRPIYALIDVLRAERETRATRRQSGQP